MDTIKTARALKILASIVGSGSKIPALHNVAISQNGRNVFFTTTDLDIQLTARLESDKSWPEATVSAKAFSSFVGLLRGDCFSAALADGALTVACDGDTARFATLPYGHFPASMRGGGKVFTLNANKFLSDIQFCQPVISRDDSRYYKRGICIDAKAGRMVATDGHRLHLADIGKIDGLPDDMPIIPEKAVKALVAIIKASPDEQFIALSFHWKTFYATIGIFSLAAKLIDATYPDYARVMPKDGNAEFSVDARELARSVKICAPVVGSPVRIAAESDNIVVRSTRLDAPTISSIVPSSGATGFDGKLYVNSLYLLQAVKSLGNGALVCRVKNAPQVSAATAWTSPESAGRMIVMMPMRI